MSVQISIHHFFYKISFSSFNAADPRSRNAALYFNFIRNTKCDTLTEGASDIQVIKASQLKQLNTNDKKEIVCRNLGRQSIQSDNLEACYWDGTPPTGVFVRSSLYGYELENIAHAFTHLADKFGAEGALADVFDLFGVFEAGQTNVIFSDDAGYLIPAANYTEIIEPELYGRMQCQK